MNKELRLKVEIKNKINNVWKVLTESEYVSRYMFGSLVETDWKPNRTIKFYLIQEDKRIDVVSGKILEYNKPTLLKHSLYPVGANYPDSPENHIEVAYYLSEDNDITNLEIVQTGFEHAQDGEKRYQDSVRGWEQALPLLKKTAESI